MEDKSSARKTYFQNMYAQFADVDIVFFDPDNGIEVKSVKKGRKNSSKYLYIDELRDTFEQHDAVLYYQHFPRVKRSLYLNQQVNRLFHEVGATQVMMFSTSHVVFFLLTATPRIYNSFSSLQKKMESQWKDQFSIATVIK